jgi:hypothetical protein
VAGAIIVHADVLEARLLLHDRGDNLGLGSVRTRRHLNVRPQCCEAEDVVRVTGELSIGRASLAKQVGRHPADLPIGRAHIAPLVPICLDDLLARQRLRRAAPQILDENRG